MRYATTSGMVLAAFTIGEAVAGPAHAHLHQRTHQKEKKDVDWAALDWANMGVDWTSAYAKGQASKTSAAVVVASTPTTTPVAAAVVKATPASTTAAAAATTTKASVEDVVEDIVSDVVSLWNNVVGLANHRTSFGSATSASGEVVGKIGNIGNPQGSNMIKVSSREGYAFTNKFVNTQKKAITVMLWNKAFSNTGNFKDALANLGASVAPKTPALSIALAPGASQIVAFMEDTQMSFAEACSDIAASAAFATTWGEVNYLAAGSGFDVSAIMNVQGNNYNMSMHATETTCVSDMTQNFWLTDSQPIGTSDGSCFIAQSTATMTTYMNGRV